MPLCTPLNSQGFTQILPSLRREPHFQNSPSALMTGRLRQVGFRAAGAAALIPSFAQEGSGSSDCSFKVVQRGMPHPLGQIPDAQQPPLRHSQKVVKRTVPLTPHKCGRSRCKRSNLFLHFFYCHNLNPATKTPPVQNAERAKTSFFLE